MLPILDDEGRDEEEEGGESLTKRDKRLATVWNWRSEGRFGIGVLSARGSAIMCGGGRLFAATTVLKSLISFDRLEIWESMCCLI
jgi:hypothetical protein